MRAQQTAVMADCGINSKYATPTVATPWVAVNFPGTIRNWNLLPRGPSNYETMDSSHTDWLSCGIMSHSTHFTDVPQGNVLAWYGKAKPNTTHSLIKRNVLQHKIKHKNKARFSHLLRHSACNWSGPILVLEFINLSLTYLHRHLPTYLQPGDTHGVHNRAV